MGLGSKLSQALGIGKKSSPINEALKATGTTVVSFGHTSARISSQEDFRQELKRKPPIDKQTALEIFEWHVEQWYKIFDMFKTNQVAFGRAGNNPAYGRMFFAVDGIAKEIDVAIINNRAILQSSQASIDTTKTNEEKNALLFQQKQLVTDFVVAYLINAGYLYIEMTSDACWFDKDVSTPATIAIQSTQPLQQDRAKVNEELLKEADVSE
jgi:hypothetical protein